MVKNTVTVNRIVTYSPVQYTIIDSRAQRVIFSNRELLYDFIKAEDYIKTGSGEVLKSPGHSTVIFKLDGPNGVVPWRIYNAIQYPDLGYNLIGTLPLTRNNIKVQLKLIGRPSKLLADSEYFGYVDIMNNQYIVRGRYIEKDSIHALTFQAPIDTNIIVTPEQLHRRIGHLNYNSIMQIPKHATRIEIKRKKPQDIYGPCMKGYQRLNIGYYPIPRATRPLQIIHSDLGGPYLITRKGYKYYTSFLYDKTSYIWIYFLKRKSDLFKALKQFYAAVENQVINGDKVIFLRSDNSGEYIDTDIQNWLKEKGIKWEPTAPYTPHQNPKVERLNYTLISAVRAILAYTRLPKLLQAELIRVIVYIRNRSPRYNSILPSPFFEINGILPDLKYLRILGSRAWVYIPKEKRIKVQDRLWQGILVRYKGTINYRIYNLTTGVVYVIRSVTIDEKSFYNKSQNIYPVDFVDEEQQESDNNKFIDPNKGDDSHADKPP